MSRRLLTTFYRILLWAYPRDFRGAVGPDATRLFVDACLEAQLESGWRGPVRRICRAAWDVPMRGLAARFVSQAPRAGDASHRRLTLFSDLSSDLRYGIRGLLRSPAFSVGVLLSMALGVALSTAMFTAFNAVLLRPWPVEHADTLVSITPVESSGLEDLRQFEKSTILTAVAASKFGFFYAAVEAGEQSRATYGRFVTPAFFDVTGVQFMLGRNFRQDENRPGTPAPVAIISHTLWQERFAGSPDVIERVIHVGKVPHVVVGVTREGWRGQQPYRDDIWLPYEWRSTTNDCCHEFVGRLAAGESRQRAAAELTVLAGKQVTVAGTGMLDRGPRHLRAVAVPAVLGLTALVLLLTGANVAHMQLARTMARGREIRTRLALGAGRTRIIRLLLAETFTLTLVAAVIAMVLVHALLDTMMTVSEVGAREVWAPDFAVYTYCILVSLVMGIVFSVLPAWRLTRTSLHQGMAHTATPGRLRFSLALLTAQVALSISLLTGAALLTRAMTHAIHGDAGFDIDGLVAVSYSRPGSASDDPEAIRAFRQTLSAALESGELPRTAQVNRLPFMGGGPWTEVRRPGEPESSRVALEVVPMSGSAFDVFGIDMAEGRAHADDPAAAEAVLNLAGAARLFPGEQALGQSFVHAGATYIVVGLTRDVYYTTRERITPMIHIAPAAVAYPVLVTRGDAHATGDQLTALLKAVDPRVIIHSEKVVDVIASRLGDERAGAGAARVGSALALGLAAFGIFGVFGFIVEERRREIGIRVALGARRSEVFRAVFRPARIAMSAGLVVGLGLSLSMSSVLEGMLFGLSPFDATAFATVAAILVLTGLVATAIPAQRALRVDPAVIMKEDA
jgi:predicted permease